MKVPVIVATVVAMLLICSSALGQVAASSAKIDVLPLELTAPDRYQIPAVLEPARRVTLIATSDSILRNQDAKAGTLVREGQQVAQLDRTEAIAKLKIAQAVVKEEKAILNGLIGDASRAATEARLEAALARADIAQLELDRTTIRAPFSGKLVSSPLSDGQFVTKGTIVAELADVSTLRVLLPISRASASVGAASTLTRDAETLSGKIQALVPLPESFSVLHELTTPFTGAWVLIPNTDSKLESGQRVRGPDLPDQFLAIIPDQAIQKPADNKAPSSIQVIRNEYVVNMNVKRLGNFLAGTVQVCGPFRARDVLIVSSSTPLAAGTLVRFNAPLAQVEGTNPNPNIAGTWAELTPPKLGSRAAPIGPPGSAAPKSNATRKPDSRTSPATRGRDDRPASNPAATESSPF